MDNTLTHTPGPWKVSGLDPNVIGPVRILVVPNAGADVPQQQAVARVTDRTGESAANARLIAAAPDLLEAARHAVMEWRLHGQLTDSCRVLEAAIAKAQG